MTIKQHLFHLKAISLTIASCLALSPLSLMAETELANQQVRLAVDPAKGTYDLIDAHDGQPIISGAGVKVEGWDSRDVAYQRTVSIESYSDTLGTGRRLRMVCKAVGKPDLILEAVIHGQDSLVVLRAGLVNNSAAPIQVHTILPANDGTLPPLADVMSLTAPSGKFQPKVSPCMSVTSTNDLLETGRGAGGRRSIVMGALRTADFNKSIIVQPYRAKSDQPPLDRAAELRSEIPGATLAAYRNADPARESVSSAVKIANIEGKLYRNGINSPFAAQDFAPKELAYSVSGLDPHRHYAMGLVWCDFDADGRVGSVEVRSRQGKDNVLLAGKALPMGEQPPRELAAVLPPESYADGQCSVVISSANTYNIVASEIWIWEIPSDLTLDPSWAAGRIVKESNDNSSTVPRVRLQASDPVGRRVSPGETYMPDDSFVVDAGVADPFAAMEKYGLTLRAANNVNLNYYAFPTICAWYVGVSGTRGAEGYPDKSLYKINTTSGMVAEADRIQQSGFLRYAPVAGRLVPESYLKYNSEDWWDDEHWRKYGYYTAPYETTEKFGAAMHDHGCLAFTYIQAEAALSPDFRSAHLEWMRGGGKDIKSGLDYSQPAVQEYLRSRFAALRGSIDGFMIDYADSMWGSEARKGQFADPNMSATAFYRMFFSKLREGIGPSARIHERNIYGTNDMTIGIVDCQRTASDTRSISPDLIKNTILRWYKNRVVVSYDMDSKDMKGAWKIAGWNGTDQDGLRMTLTMAYVAAGRLLLANSFRDLSPEAIRDLSRTFPYPTEPKTARPIDAFTRSSDCPMVYDYAVSPDWHQVTLYNAALPGKPQTITVPMSGEQVDGALGLDPAKSYYVYDFWNDTYAGCISGSGSLVQNLRSGEARMLAIHAVEPNPQFIATDRHIMQGLLDLPVKPNWNAGNKSLSGTARVVANDPFRIIIATNGYHLNPSPVAASGAVATVAMLDDAKGLAVLTLTADKSADARWSVIFQ
jgi:hypothetical protein